jgi:hypothetical protein
MMRMMKMLHHTRQRTMQLCRGKHETPFEIFMVDIQGTFRRAHVFVHVLSFL